jgi:acylphosphatase
MEGELTERAAFTAIVNGRVQGVYFRDFVRKHAEVLDLTGYVRNLPGGRQLEVHAEGEKQDLHELLNQLNKGPRLSKVNDVDIDWINPTGGFSHFEIQY